MKKKELNIITAIWLSLFVLWFFFGLYWLIVSKPVISWNSWTWRISWAIILIILFAFVVYGHWLYRQHLKLERPELKIRELTHAEKILEIFTVIWGLFFTIYFYFLKWSDAGFIITITITFIFILLWILVYRRAKRRGEI